MTTPTADLVIPELLQGQWTTALICTYGADLTFFETRLLGQLAQIPLRIVLADDVHLAETLAESARTGQRHRFANRSYVAAPVRHPRAAHSKLIALLGPTNGLLVVGSGNLGYDGYAAPGELWHVYAYSDDQPHNLQEFAAARSHIDGLASRGLLDPPVIELLQTAWSQAPWLAPEPTLPTAIHSNLDRPLVDQLRDAVTDPVEELIAHAPFHDAECAALQELIRRFQPKRTRLLLTDATSADPVAIQRVMQAAPQPVLERVHVKAEPSAYIHAKWVHLIHNSSETLLTGSANLSRTALLRSADSGNVEIGIISMGARGSFEPLYAHLDRSRIDDPASLKIAFQGSPNAESVEEAHPVVLWSRLDGQALTLVFSHTLTDDVDIEVLDHTGTPLTWNSKNVDRAQVRLDLTNNSAERLAEGGRIQVRLDGKGNRFSHSWPYHLGYLRSRLDKAGHRIHLPHIVDLPEQDAELYELLQELDATLIIDRASVWRIAKRDEPTKVETNEDSQPTIKLEDLDWTRVRRDHRYRAYFGGGRAPGAAPTDIQVILAAIAGRLGDIGVVDPRAPQSDEAELANEGDNTSSDVEDDDQEDELEDELLRRRLPISTRTRMAFDRFARRYSKALEDTAFTDELGPIPATTNAIIFNHLLIRLQARNAISPAVVLSAQLATWRFLWGSNIDPGVIAAADDDAADVIRQLLRDANARVATVRGLVTVEEGAGTAGELTTLRGLTRRLLVDADFGLDCDLLQEATGNPTLAGGLLDSLSRVATPGTPTEILDVVTADQGTPRGTAHWRHETVRRAGAAYDATTFVLTESVEHLTPELALEFLGRVVVAATFAGHPGSYRRIRFEGNGKSVAFWDGDAHNGLVMVNGDDEDLAALDAPWPLWVRKVELMHAELAQRSHVANLA